MRNLDVVDRVCQQCGGHFQALWRNVKHNGARFCNRDCRGKFLRRPLVERFWEKVQIGDADDCWPWTAACDQWGYGIFGSADLPTPFAHRIGFYLTYHYWPPVVMHSCDNPPCVNPKHLLPGTHALNVADRDRKGRRVVPKGEANWATKYSDALKERLYEMWDAGGVTRTELAYHFGMSRSSVYRLLSRRAKRGSGL